MKKYQTAFPTLHITINNLLYCVTILRKCYTLISFEVSSCQILVKMIVNDKAFAKSLNQSIKESKDKKLTKTFYPTATFQSRLARRYNLSFKKSSTTQYDLQSLKAELVPTLQQTFALRKAFSIPGGQGRIWNIDESMTYRYDEQSRIWTV